MYISLSLYLSLYIYTYVNIYIYVSNIHTCTDICYIYIIYITTVRLAVYMYSLKYSQTCIFD